MSDLISRADAIEEISKGVWNEQELIDRFKALPSDAVDCTEFIEWLVDRVLDETIWEYNSVAYGEIICRKLEKLGVLEVTEEPSYYIRPSADAEPIVIRAKTLLPTKDFKEWAKRIREVNPNAVVIPCDSEVASADAVQGEWVEVEEQPYFRKHYDTVCCSVCRKKGNRKWNFCPNCGARMKGGAE